MAETDERATAIRWRCTESLVYTSAAYMTLRLFPFFLLLLPPAGCDQLNQKAASGKAKPAKETPGHRFVLTRSDDSVAFDTQTGQICRTWDLNRDPALAKMELHYHLGEIRMTPHERREEWHYVAEETWNLLGTGPNAPVLGLAHSDGCGGQI